MGQYRVHMWSGVSFAILLNASLRFWALQVHVPGVWMIIPSCPGSSYYQIHNIDGLFHWISNMSAAEWAQKIKWITNSTGTANESSNRDVNICSVLVHEQLGTTKKPDLVSIFSFLLELFFPKNMEQLLFLNILIFKIFILFPAFCDILHYWTMIRDKSKYFGC